MARRSSILLLLLALACIADGRAGEPVPTTKALVWESAELLAAGQEGAAAGRYTAAMQAGGENTPELQRRLLFDRALALWALDRVDLAQQERARLGKLFPDTPLADALDCFFRLTKGDVAGALKFLPDPDSCPEASAVQVLAMLRDNPVERRNDLAVAAANLKEPDPQNYLCWRALAEWNEFEGRTPEALAAWRAAAAALPKHAPTHEKYVNAARDWATSISGTALQEAIQTAFATPELAEFDRQAALLAGKMPQPLQGIMERQRERLVATQADYHAALAARAQALDKKDYPAVAAADRRAAQLTPSAAAASDHEAEAQLATGYDQFSHGLPGSAVLSFTRAATGAFSPELAAEGRRREQEVRKGLRALVDQRVAAEDWTGLLAALDDYAQLGPLDYGYATYRSAALISLLRLPEAIASMEQTLARSDLSAADRKSTKEMRLSLLDKHRTRELARAWQLWKTGRYEPAVQVIQALVDSGLAVTETEVLLADRYHVLNRPAEARQALLTAYGRAPDDESKAYCLRALYAFKETPPNDYHRENIKVVRLAIGDKVHAEIQRVLSRKKGPPDPLLHRWLTVRLDKDMELIRDLASRLRTPIDMGQKYLDSINHEVENLKNDLGNSWSGGPDMNSPFAPGSWMNPYSAGPSYLGQRAYDEGLAELRASVYRDLDAAQDRALENERITKEIIKVAEEMWKE